jgi:hypothetical protein
MRSGIAVDRLEPGKSELHRTACLEFAHNAGWWFLVQFADEEGRKKWEPRVMAAIRLLADSGFGGRRSIGWGRAQIADVASGPLAEMVFGRRAREKTAAPQDAEPVPADEAPATPPEAEAPTAETPAPADAEVGLEDTTGAEQPPAEEPFAAEEAPAEPPSTVAESAPAVAESERDPEPSADNATATLTEETSTATGTPQPEAEPETSAQISVKPSDIAGLAASPPEQAPAQTAWWLLSLFIPGPDDSIDWDRGAYALLAREGRIESPARWGDQKKTSRMVVEGSLLVSANAPSGGALDVAPDGFPHSVFRAGFAVAIPVPYRSGA